MADVDVVFKTTDAALEIVNHLSKEFVVPLTCLVVFDFLAIGIYDPVSCVLTDKDW